jgi:hypothetical protein
MSNAITSSNSGLYSGFGTNVQGENGSAPSLYQLGVAPQGASQEDTNIAPPLSVLPLEATALMSERTVAELAIRRLSQEIEHAKQELVELEKGLVHEVNALSVRGWLLPLMAIGLSLSFYGSLWSVSAAEMGATGLMLLWSLAAFWVLYRRERIRDRTEQAFMAEIEIWSKRIEELQHSLEQNQRIVAADEQAAPAAP